MRNVLPFPMLLLVFLATPALAHDPAQSQPTAQASKPVQVTADGTVYGAALLEPSPRVHSLDAVIANPDPWIGQTGAFSGRITEVCQKQGCWMVLSSDNGDFVRVLMRDHAFFVPKDAHGQAVVYGTLSEKQLSAEEIEHLKQEGSAVPSKRELRISANSVLIRNAG